MPRSRRIFCARCREQVPAGPRGQDYRVRCRLCLRTFCLGCAPGGACCRDCAPPDRAPPPWNHLDPTRHDAKIFYHGRVAYGVIAAYTTSRRGGPLLLLSRRLPAPQYRNQRGRRLGRTGQAVDDTYNGPPGVPEER